MSEKRFKLAYEKGNEAIFEDRKDVYPKRMTNKEVEKLLNEQQATINELKAKLKEKEEDEQLYANEILELREANKEYIQFKSLGGDY